MLGAFFSRTVTCQCDRNNAQHYLLLDGHGALNPPKPTARKRAFKPTGLKAL